MSCEHASAVYEEGEDKRPRRQSDYRRRVRDSNNGLPHHWLAPYTESVTFAVRTSERNSRHLGNFCFFLSHPQDEKQRKAYTESKVYRGVRSKSEAIAFFAMGVVPFRLLFPSEINRGF
ncbi:hypothetical protein MRX96_023366 [Rhipicephalus microplus]